MKLETAKLESQDSATSGLDSEQLERLGQILDDLLVQSEAGQVPDVELACQNNADLSQAIRYYVRSIQLLNQVAFDGRPDSRRPLNLSHHQARKAKVSSTAFNELTKSAIDSGAERPQVTLSLADLSLTGLSQAEQDSLGELGDFRLIREIGRGGMGVVYEARQLSLARRVALKILPFAAVLDSRQIARFQNEAQAAASLQHPNIVPVYSVGNDRGTHFYSMQYIDGHSLDLIVEQLQDKLPVLPPDQPLKTDSRPPQDSPSTIQQQLRSTVNEWAMASTVNSHRSANYIESVVQLFIQAADALHYAHQHGIVHRDIKPSNLMVDRHGKLWVTDFGLAQCRSSNHESFAGANLTRSGDFLGTLRYMSPEQATGKPHLVDHRTDIYSLGATLYELLTLQPLVSGSDRVEMIRQIDQGVVRSPRKLNSAIPVTLETIILKSLASCREDRYGSAIDLADDLRRFASGDVPKAKRLTWFDRAGRSARQHPKTIVLSVLCLTALFVVSLTISAILQRKNGQIEVALEKADRHLAIANQAVYLFGPKQLGKLELLAGTETMRLEIANEALNYFESFTQYASSDVNLQRDVASAKMICGDLELQLGRVPSAEEHFEAAVAILNRLRLDQSRRVGDGIDLLAELLLSRNNLAVAQARSGDLSTAKATLEGSLTLLAQNEQHLSSAAPADRDRLLAVEVLTRLHLGQVAADLGDTLRADNEFRKTMRLADGIQIPLEAIGAKSGTIVGEVYSLVIATLLEASRLEHQSAEQATASIELALTLAEKLGNDQLTATIEPSANPEYLPQAQMAAKRDLALCRVALGSNLLANGQIMKARSVLSIAENELQQLHHTNPLIQQISIDYATALNNLGQCDLELSNFSAAEESLTQAEKLLTQFRSFGNNFLIEHSLGGVYNNLSIANQRKGDIEQARRYIAKAIEHQQLALKLSPGNQVCENFLKEHQTLQEQLLELPQAQATGDSE